MELYYEFLGMSRRIPAGDRSGIVGAGKGKRAHAISLNTEQRILATDFTDYTDYRTAKIRISQPCLFVAGNPCNP
jgi:hypothetical protein